MNSIEYSANHLILSVCLSQSVLEVLSHLYSSRNDVITEALHVGLNSKEEDNLSESRSYINEAFSFFPVMLFHDGQDLFNRSDSWLSIT